MATTKNSGTQSCTVTTDHSLDTDADAGIYVGIWNLDNSVNGDVFQLTLLEKVLTGDTARILYQGFYAHDLGEFCIVPSPPVVSMFSIEMKVKQIAGTSRNVPWSLIQIDA